MPPEAYPFHEKVVVIKMTEDIVVDPEDEPDPRFDPDFFSFDYDTGTDADPERATTVETDDSDDEDKKQDSSECIFFRVMALVAIISMLVVLVMLHLATQMSDIF